MSDFYRFPAMAKLGEWKNSQQVSKLLEEAVEAGSASFNLTVARFEDDQDLDAYRKLYGEELMDVIHAAETALRMEFTPEEVVELRDAVEKKNWERGYYQLTTIGDVIAARDAFLAEYDAEDGEDN